MNLGFSVHGILGHPVTCLIQISHFIQRIPKVEIYNTNILKNSYRFIISNLQSFSTGWYLVTLHKVVMNFPEVKYTASFEHGG